MARATPATKDEPNKAPRPEPEPEAARGNGQDPTAMGLDLEDAEAVLPAPDPKRPKYGRRQAPVGDDDDDDEPAGSDEDTTERKKPSPLVLDPYAVEDVIKDAPLLGSAVPKLALARPSKAGFIQAHPDPKMRAGVVLFRPAGSKDDDDWMLVAPEALNDVRGEGLGTLFELVPCEDRNGRLYWFKLNAESDDEYTTTLREILRADAVGQWVKIVTDRRQGCYNPDPGPGIRTVPRWRGVTFENKRILVERAFLGKTIKSVEDELIQRELGNA